MKDRIAEIVSNVGADFSYGKPRQILSDIIQRTQSISSQINYPLIILEYPFPYPRKDHYYDCTAKLYLCQTTKPEIHNDERYADNYEPILLPLSNRLYDEINRVSLSFSMTTQEDNPFASVQIGNDKTGYMPEYFDIIETGWKINLPVNKIC